MSIATVADLLQAIRALRLLDPPQLQTFAQFQQRFQDPRALAKKLQEAGWLTTYQLREVFKHGAKAELLLGPYVILDKLGQGGMGQVLKARDTRHKRVVALKIIRKDKLDKPKTLQRFLREIQVASQLNHPNIVLAYDASDVNGTYFFAMEYVEGIVLAKRVRDSGPLPVEEACDYVRQTALGLQHVHERGLIHRDIKPANLIVTKVQAPGLQPLRFGIVKLLDMGMARFDEMNDDGAQELTMEGTMVGTPDYMAPEQIRNARSADIRSDLYGLGCTFYYLLTGQVPFPGGGLADKIFKHQAHEPVAVEQLRAGLAPAVTAVVRKLMAKRAEDRYQTPAELATVLVSILKTSPPVAAVPPTAVPLVGANGKAPSAGPAVAVAVRPEVVVGSHSSVADARSRRSAHILSSPRERRRLLMGIGIGSGFGLLLIAFLCGFSMLGGSPSTAPVSTRPRTDVKKTTYLSDLNEMDVSVGWGQFGKNGELNYPNDSRYGTRIVVNGIEAKHGLSMHPPARGAAQVTYALGKQFETFEAAVALNDTSQARARPLVFLVYGDGAVLWTSAPVHRRGESQPCSVSVNGVDRLQLQVQCPGPNQMAHAVWIDPLVR